MIDNRYLAATICEKLDNGLSLVLASIIKVQGSSPGREGFKLVIGEDGKSAGTIGGGGLEAAVAKTCQAVLASGQSRVLEYRLTNTDVSAPGMTCGGIVTVLLDYIKATKANAGFFRCWRDAVCNGDEFYFLTRVKGAGDAVKIAGHSMLFPDGTLFGDCPDIDSLKGELQGASSTIVLSAGDDRIVVDPVCRTGTLYCFGAGHIAVPTARIAAIVGFRVVVLDNRAEYATGERFPDTRDIRVLKDYGHAFEGLEIDADSFIVILTHGHLHDLAVLEQALKTSAGYIGMIGSRKKKDLVYKALVAKGIKKEELKRVHSPIGLDIGGNTPEEIAVSIVAELIKVRSNRRP